MANDPATLAQVNNPEHWGSFDVAHKTLLEGSMAFDGVGILLGDGLTGVDLDDCVEGGTLNAFAKETVAALNSYAEISPSGTGIKIFLLANLGKNYAQPGVEIYGFGRYFTVTGQQIDGTPDEPQERSQELTAFIRKVVIKPAPDTSRALLGHNALDVPREGAPRTDPLPVDGAPLVHANRNTYLFGRVGAMRRLNMSDEEIIEACKSLNKHRCRPPLDESEVVGIVRSSKRYAPEQAEAAIDDMNRKHAVISENGKTIVISPAEDPETQRSVHHRSTFEDIRNRYLSTSILVNHGERDQQQSLGDLWLEHPRRREYDGVIFDPAEENKNGRMFNLWTGRSIEPRPGDWSLFKDHLALIVCNGNEEYFDFFYKWLARLYQFPGKPAETAIAMRGVEGIGKGLVARNVGSIVSRHFVSLSNPKHLIGNFNAALEGAVVVFADEAVVPQDKVGESMLKNLVTEPTVQIERKGKDSYHAKNVVHLLMASNNSWVLPAGLQSRRFFIIDPSPKHVGNLKYFGRMQEQMTMGGGRSAMLDELLRVDLKGWDFQLPPKTPALDEQKRLSMSPIETWWEEKIDKGKILGAQRWPTAISVPVLWLDYQELVMKNHGRVLFERQFVERLLRFTPLTIGQRKEGIAHLDFPTLNECRDHWTKTTDLMPLWEKDLLA